MSRKASPIGLIRLAYGETGKWLPLGATAFASRNYVRSLYSHGIVSPSSWMAILWASKGEVYSLPAGVRQMRTLHRSIHVRVKATSVKSAQSATPQSWVSRLPSRLQSYALLTRIDKPIGVLLLYYPCGMHSYSLVHVGSPQKKNPPTVSNVIHFFFMK